jgi:hypothetical protein
VHTYSWSLHGYNTVVGGIIHRAYIYHTLYLYWILGMFCSPCITVQLQAVVRIQDCFTKDQGTKLFGVGGGRWEVGGGSVWGYEPLWNSVNLRSLKWHFTAFWVWIGQKIKTLWTLPLDLSLPSKMEYIEDRESLSCLDRYIDPTSLIHSLGLDTAQQQVNTPDHVLSWHFFLRQWVLTIHICPSGWKFVC